MTWTKDRASWGGDQFATKDDSSHSVFSASVYSGEEKSYKVLSALCGVSPDRNEGAFKEVWFNASCRTN